MLNRILNHLEEWLIAFLIGAATLVIFFAVVHRFLSGVPWIQDYTVKMNVSWAQELCIFMFVWMAKFGAAYGVRTGIHVGVDVLVNQMNAPWRRKFVVLGLAAGALFTAIVGTLGARFVFELSHTSSTSEVLEIPMWMVYMAVPLGSYLMCFRFLQVIVSFLRTGDLPRHDHSHVEGLEEEDISGAKI